MNKLCAHCRSPFGRETLSKSANFARAKYCSRRCYDLSRKLSPATADSFYWPKVEKGEGCWRWQGRHDASGYGRYDRKGPYVYAHRIAWLFTNGEIPADMDVLHRCDVRDCCNPTHLFLGTHEDNMLDMRRKGRHTYGEKNMHAKITEDQAKAIMLEYRKDGPHKRDPSNTKELAAKYGLSVGAVMAVVNGRSWKHLRPSPK